MSRVRTGPVIGLGAQIVLLAGLATTVGLDAAGWLAGVGYGVVLCAALTRGLRRRDRAGSTVAGHPVEGDRSARAPGADRSGPGWAEAADRPAAARRSRACGLGPADRVTLARAVLVGGVTALVVDAVAGPAPLRVLVPLAAVALALDAVDGLVARRTGTASALGARFDMEVDAFLILVLSVQVAPATGGWVLAIGAMRYGYVAAGRVLPWLRGGLPARYWRKVVAAAQGVLLLTAAADVLPPGAATVLVAVALALLVESFGHDVGWLWWHRPARALPPAAAVPAAAARPAPDGAVATAMPAAEGRPARAASTAPGRAPSVPTAPVPASRVPAASVPV